MIEMIFEGGYTYMMTEQEFYILITTSGIGMVASLGITMVLIKNAFKVIGKVINKLALKGIRRGH